jgi:MFS transporter, DHA1 family, inner membrane transport protein
LSEQIQKSATGRRVPLLALKIGLLTFARLLLSTSRRFPYPFAPVLSRGLGVSLTSITSMIAVNQATAIIGMLFGPLADRLGYRLMMITGLAMLTAGMFAGGIFPFFGIVMAGMFLAGLGKSIFDPAIQAYVAERVPFERRGTVIGIIEFSWAGCTLVGIPLIAVLIDRFGWRAPFFALAGAGLVCMGILEILIPAEKSKVAGTASAQGIMNAWRRMLLEPSARGALGFAFFVSLANDNLFVVYGAWLEDIFGLSILAIGIGTTAIGFAELSGEILTALFGDRFGLKRSVLVGLLLSSLTYGLLPFLEGTLTLALGGLFLIFIVFEFTIVSFISLCTELHPAHRATMMSAFYAAAGVGRIIGALIGGHVWLSGGIFATALVSALFSLFALISLAWGLRRWRTA